MRLGAPSGMRSRLIQNKLRNVESLDAGLADRLLQIDSPEEIQQKASAE